MEENKVIEPMEGISVGTIARTVCLFVALANQVMVMFDLTPIQMADDMIYQLVSVGATVITALVAWWKDNAFTTKALKAEAYKKELK